MNKKHFDSSVENLKGGRKRTPRKIHVRSVKIAMTKKTGRLDERKGREEDPDSGSTTSSRMRTAKKKGRNKERRKERNLNR